MSPENKKAVRFALALAGIDLQAIEINYSPAPCIDDSAESQHSTDNACTWYEPGSDGLILRKGRVSKAGRVTEFSKGKQKVLHFGGSWDNPIDIYYRAVRWDHWNAQG